MKKIFGFLSLIAILTVAFSTKAIANDTDNNNVVVFTADAGNVSLIATDVAPDFSNDFGTFGEVDSGAVFNSNDVGLGGSVAEAVPIVTGRENSPFINSEAYTIGGDPDEPIRLEDSTNTKGDIPDNTCNDSNSSWFGTHTGKLNRYNVKS